jgi:hypothetical protein
LICIASFWRSAAGIERIEIHDADLRSKGGAEIDRIRSPSDSDSPSAQAWEQDVREEDVLLAVHGIGIDVDEGEQAGNRANDLVAVRVGIRVVAQAGRRTRAPEAGARRSFPACRSRCRQRLEADAMRDPSWPHLARPSRQSFRGHRLGVLGDTAALALGLGRIDPRLEVASR